MLSLQLPCPRLPLLCYFHSPFPFKYLTFKYLMLVNYSWTMRIFSTSRLTGGVTNRKIRAKVNGACRENKTATAVQTTQTTCDKAESDSIGRVGQWQVCVPLGTTYRLLPQVQSEEEDEAKRRNGLICRLLTRQNGGMCL